MDYNKACEILGFTTPKSLRANAELAAARLNRLTTNAPLRFKVACRILIKAGAQ